MPIIFMSGAAHALEKCRPRAFACLQKPFNIEVFVDTVRSAIATSPYSRT
jgi:FixJ family two-component response regulator